MAEVSFSGRRDDDGGDAAGRAEVTHARGRLRSTPSGFLLLVVSVLWFASLPLAITNRNAAALGIYACGLVLCGLMLFCNRGAIVVRVPEVAGEPARQPAPTAPVREATGGAGVRDGARAEARAEGGAGATATPETTLEREESRALAEMEKTLHSTVNGATGLRLPLYKHPQLWHVATSLNYLLARLEQYGEAHATLHVVERQARAVAEAVRARRGGGVPAWPAPRGTPVDEIVEALRDDVVVEYRPQIPDAGWRRIDDAGELPPRH